MNSGNTQLRDSLVQAFCEMGDAPKKVIAPQKIRERFDGFTSMGPHCIEAGEKFCIWRVFTPFTAAADIQTVRHVRQAHQHAQRLKRSFPFRDLVESGSYGFAVLVNDQARAQRLRALFKERPLPEIVPLVVCLLNENEGLHR